VTKYSVPTVELCTTVGKGGTVPWKCKLTHLTRERRERHLLRWYTQKDTPPSLEERQTTDCQEGQSSSDHTFSLEPEMLGSKQTSSKNFRNLFEGRLPFITSIPSPDSMIAHEHLTSFSLHFSASLSQLISSPLKVPVVCMISFNPSLLSSAESESRAMTSRYFCFGDEIGGCENSEESKGCAEAGVSDSRVCEAVRFEA